MPTKFYLERQTNPHHGDRIYFQTHPERSLSVEDAVELTAQLIDLIKDDQAIGKRVSQLRGVEAPSVARGAASQAPAQQEASDAANDAD